MCDLSDLLITNVLIYQPNYTDDIFIIPKIAIMSSVFCSYKAQTGRITIDVIQTVKKNVSAIKSNLSRNIILSVLTQNGGYARIIRTFDFYSIVSAIHFPFNRLFNLHHSVTNADMRLDVLGGIGVLLQLFAERRHKDAQRGNVVIPTASPNALRNKCMSQNLSDIS